LESHFHLNIFSTILRREIIIIIIIFSLRLRPSFTDRISVKTFHKTLTSERRREWEWNIMEITEGILIILWEISQSAFHSLSPQKPSRCGCSSIFELQLCSYDMCFAMFNIDVKLSKALFRLSLSIYEIFGFAFDLSSLFLVKHENMRIWESKPAMNARRIMWNCIR
jgi:hypothetical protein